MADSIQRSDSIASSGFPLGFKVAQGKGRPGVVGDSASRDTFCVELRAMGGHQKEAVVTEGSEGPAFRAVSDEGPGLNGTDLAPNPLSFFAAALPADIMSRFVQIARAQGVPVEDLSSEQATVYGFEGSLMKGDGKGSARAPQVKLKLRSAAAVARLREIAHPLDTHIFLHGEETDERMEKLLLMAQHTCFLHALLASALEPALEWEVNGAIVGV
jgi:uncharacterized OsmC-like protein